ncbi:AAA family ATPase [Curtobacterium sp. MCBD17_023]|uniref:ATP-binding protein n=1 Tax=Curtobacterium sp. MCBD17_023 TaxID=2175657 RepID=UPI000D894335|nr:LuxR family transcriptional regulator [Curtobacterium sp. MCBD17_023]PYY51962.1 LuxR family transcriptional regulator [Curtobacterium sp. MCBD17_023]
MIGRSEELATLRSIITQVVTTGQAVIVEGEAGIGKSALISEAVQLTVDAGFRQLRCAGMQSETTAGFASLHELLHPVLGQIHTLPSRQRGALLTAFGFEDGPEPDRLLISLAVLGLLEEIASQQPVVLIVEDLQWLDASTVEAITFVARRLTTAPILMLIAARTSGEVLAGDPLAGLPLTRINLGPFTVGESREFLDTVPVELTREQRSRVLDEAAGNPLALREFATSVSTTAGDDALSPFGRLPTTRRLEQNFLGTVSALPFGCRRMLLLAATAHDPVVNELFAAGQLLGLAPSELDAAERAGLVSVSGGRLSFRHPLVRSAVYGAATTTERGQAHHALAEVSTDFSRAAWHRAAASDKRDERVAAELEEAAEQARRRGAQPEAVAALHRAATLTPDVGDRVRRLATAAEIARRAGATAVSARLVEEAIPLAGDEQVVVGLTSTQLLLSMTAGTPGPSGVELMGLARRLGGAEGTDHPAERIAVLWTAAVGYYGQPASGEARHRVEAEVLAIEPSRWDPYRQMALGLLDPVHRADGLRPELPRLAAALSEDTLGLQSLALTSESLQDLPMAFESWSMAADRARRTGFQSDECQALRGRANMHLMLGRLLPALDDIERAMRMVEDQALPVTEAAVTAIAARVMAWQGDLVRASATLARSRERAAEAPLALVSADQAWAGGLIALAEQRYQSAWAELADVANHPVTAMWAVADLTEAAVRAGAQVAVTPIVESAARDAEVMGAAHLDMLIGRSRALLAPEDDAELHFRSAIDSGVAAGTLLELARTRLLYGEWLRRQRRPLHAREQLGQALRTFEAAGARALVGRVLAELRAAGVATPSASHRHRSDAISLLTPQELQIARLAARGMTNREIADQVYLSHRTVSTHLYKAFPKLGITARGQLREALTRADDGQSELSREHD